MYLLMKKVLKSLVSKRDVVTKSLKSHVVLLDLPRNLYLTTRGRDLEERVIQAQPQYLKRQDCSKIHYDYED